MIWTEKPVERAIAISRYLAECTARDDRVLLATNADTVVYFARRLIAGGQRRFTSNVLTSESDQRLVLERLARQSVPVVHRPQPSRAAAARASDTWKSLRHRVSISAARHQTRCSAVVRRRAVIGCDVRSPAIIHSPASRAPGNRIGSQNGPRATEGSGLGGASAPKPSSMERTRWHGVLAESLRRVPGFGA